LSMTDKVIAAIKEALARGMRVELTPQRDGSVKVRTVIRKDLKI